MVSLVKRVIGRALNIPRWAGTSLRRLSKAVSKAFRNAKRSLAKKLKRHPFYRSVERHPITKKVLRRYRGLHLLAKSRAAMRHRSRHGDATYIGITGSCGKTTTSNLLTAVLSTAGHAHDSGVVNLRDRLYGNILSVGPDTAYCVQEVSGHRRGAVADAVKVLRPDIGIVTVVESDHYTIFRNREATAKEKRALIDGLPETGVAILNADDEHVLAMAGRTKARVVTFGQSSGADYRAVGVSGNWPERLTVTVAHGDDEFRVRTQLVGETWTTTILAAFACAVELGLEPDRVAGAIAEFKPVFARCSVHRLPNGVDMVLDSQKAPFWTIASALDVVREAEAPRRTIVFGTISDYPGATSARYRRVARDALKAADRVVFVGPQSGHVTKLPETGDRLFAFETVYQASEFLAEDAVANELVFVKASISDHLERLMLSQREDVVCWKERCGRLFNSCPDCPMFRRASPPPFGLAKKIEARAL